jgi:hypothetical protein
MTTSRYGASRFASWLGIALVLLAAPFVPTHAQASPQSIAAWTQKLRSGSLLERADALAELTRGPVATLPPATRLALVAELTRVHAALLAGKPIGAPDDGELVTDYYMELVDAVAELRTPEANLALAPAVAVSGGIARRVARLGDVGVNAVLPLLRRGYETSSMLETLGLAWFWADSTHARLSDRSRARIVTAFTAAAASDSLEPILGVMVGAENAADPVFLPLATSLRDRVSPLGGAQTVAASMLTTTTIPKLTALAAARSPADLARGAARAISALCTPRDAGDDEHGEGARDQSGQDGHSSRCAALARDFSAVSRSIQLGRIAEARTTLRALGRAIEQAFAARELTRPERDLLAGNVSILLARLGP